MNGEFRANRTLDAQLQRGAISIERPGTRSAGRGLPSILGKRRHFGSATVPGLTLHDEAHFDALWARADQIAGEQYRLNPLELFVLGGAILLHDNANSVAAFAGGLGEIKATPEWADAVADWRERQPKGASPDPLPASATDAILFDTLRSIHADRALTLADMSVEVDGSTHHLIPDDGLRRHLGELIGQIAASHHWNVSALQHRLPDRVGVPAGMPHQWSIRPLVIAGLLRCADAIQLDQSRAPDFLFGLLKLRGLSAEHWRAQNRLAAPTSDPGDPGALLMTSTMAFTENAADAWWVAFDAIQVANRELQSVDAILRDVRLPPFAISRIRGAESPLRLAREVRVSGWRPVDAEVTINDISKVVGTFGGEQLYGDDYSVPLRELIQNAADAVKLRRNAEPDGSSYRGRITVRLTNKADGSGILSVEDDGIGMSEAVLTGPLIDFGGSYMSSVIVKQERSGLKSKARKRIGKYGIGFFSVFMLSDEVRIASRPFDAGLDKVRTLRFRRGISDRPLLLDDLPENFDASISSRINIELSAEKLASLLKWPPRSRDEATVISIAALVGILCPMLDVDVHVDEGSGATRIHHERWFEEDRETWLRRILVPEITGNAFIEDQIKGGMHRLRQIDPEDPSAGIAAITPGGSAGVKTVATLKSPVFFGQTYADDFLGAIDYEPAGPRRDTGNARAKALLAAWASEQALLIASDKLELPRRQYAAERVAEFGGDATPIFGLRLDKEWADLDDIVKRLADGEMLYAPIKAGDRDGTVEITVVREHHSGFIDNYKPDELKYLVPALEGTDGSKSALYRVPTESDPATVGFFGIIGARLSRQGFILECEGPQFRIRRVCRPSIAARAAAARQEDRYWSTEIARTVCSRGAEHTRRKTGMSS